MDFSAFLVALEQIPAFCRAAIGSDGPLLATLFMAGLVGGMVHCAGMCGPFVFAQVASRPGSADLADAPAPVRLLRALLVPYHLGRATTYAGLGAAAAGITGGIVEFTEFRWIAAILLVIAALFFLGNSAWQWRPALPMKNLGSSTFGKILSPLVGPLLIDPGPVRRYVLGLILGFLPCGLLYGAIAAAATADNAAVGALAMIAFTAGTVPSLVGVGFVGHFLGRRWQTQVRALGGILMVANAVVLTVLAWNVVV